MNIMLDFQQKRKARSFMYHKATLVVLGVLVLLAIHSTWSVYQKKRESQEMKSLSLKHVEELRLRDTELNIKINRLDTSPGLEEEIRAKFTVAKENENMVMVVEDANADAATTTSEKKLWKKIKHLFRIE